MELNAHLRGPGRLLGSPSHEPVQMTVIRRYGVTLRAKELTRGRHKHEPCRLSSKLAIPPRPKVGLEEMTAAFFTSAMPRQGKRIWAPALLRPAAGCSGQP